HPSAAFLFCRSSFPPLLHSCRVGCDSKPEEVAGSGGVENVLLLLSFLSSYFYDPFQPVIFSDRVPSASFEVLNFSFVFFRPLTRCEGPKIPPLSGFRVLRSRVQAVLTCFEFPDHLSALLWTVNRPVILP
ncbi:MAG TPA: hypothetical protein VLN91_06145, partial [Nitrospirota bacterium]|nr:hypothetical protein [Nitrospirota bacterium]